MLLPLLLISLFSYKSITSYQEYIITGIEMQSIYANFSVFLSFYFT
jgi:hypothetical protein